MNISSELYEFITRIVEEKVRDVKVAREEFDKLVTSIKELAEAQKRTEERLNALAEAQRRTEEELNTLAAKVAELTESISKLTQAMVLLRQEMGRLSETIGFGLEDVAKVILPSWISKHLGIEVSELERRFFFVGGKEIEVNIYGEGVKDGRKVVILGECKSRVYSDDVLRFYENVYKPLKPILGEVVGILFGFLIHPSATEVAKKLGLYTVASYQR